MSRKKSQMRSRLENFGYALQLTRRFYPQKLICTIVLTVLKGVISFFSLQYMLRYVINGATNGVPFRSLIAFMLLMLGANILFKCIDAAYSTLVNPLISRLSEAKLEKQIMNKLLGIDLANYEDPEAYDLAMRAASMQITKRAMLSRAVSVIRGRTLIINLPGSPKACMETMDVFMDTIPHGLGLLRGTVHDCARA